MSPGVLKKWKNLHHCGARGLFQEQNPWRCHDSVINRFYNRLRWTVIWKIFHPSLQIGQIVFPQMTRIFWYTAICFIIAHQYCTICCYFSIISMQMCYINKKVRPSTVSYIRGILISIHDGPLSFLPSKNNSKLEVLVPNTRLNVSPFRSDGNWGYSA